MNELQPGTLIDDRYTIVEFIGGGGMGDVYRAREKELNRPVAIKILQATMTGDTDMQARFKREGRVLSSLRHSNLVAFYRFGFCADTSPYIAMEYLEGRSLREVLEERKTGLPIEQILSIALQVCHGMASAHTAGIIHRDLKPANIMMVGEGEQTVKIVDFGLARILPGGVAATGSDSQTGLLVGTVQYMSPEQCQGSKADRSSDMYALGCILYEMSTGRPPFEADSPITMIHKHINEPAPALPAAITDNRQWASLALIIAKALQKDPGNRYPSADAMRSDIDLIMQGLGDQIIVALPPRKVSSTRASLMVRHRLLIIAAVCIAVIAIVSAGLLRCRWETILPLALRPTVEEFEGDVCQLLFLSPSLKYQDALLNINMNDRKAEEQVCRLAVKLFSDGQRNRSKTAMAQSIVTLLVYYTNNAELLDAEPVNDASKGIPVIRSLFAQLRQIPDFVEFDDKLIDALGGLLTSMSHGRSKNLWMITELQLLLFRRYPKRIRENSAMHQLGVQLLNIRELDSALECLDTTLASPLENGGLGVTCLELERARVLALQGDITTALSYAKWSLNKIRHEPPGKYDLNTMVYVSQLVYDVADVKDFRSSNAPGYKDLVQSLLQLDILYKATDFKRIGDNFGKCLKILFQRLPCKDGAQSLRLFESTIANRSGPMAERLQEILVKNSELYHFESDDAR